MEDVFLPIVVVGMLFIGMPWLVLHYVTQWRKTGSLSLEDEKLLDELHETARRLEEQQLEQDVAHASGPTIDAFASPDLVCSDDLGSEERWPAWTGAARELGVRSMIALPLVSAAAQRTQAVLVQRVGLETAITPAVRIGPWSGRFLVALTAVGLLFTVLSSGLPYRRRRNRQQAEDDGRPTTAVPVAATTSEGTGA